MCKIAESKETVLRTLEEEQVGRGFVSAPPQAVHGHQSEVAVSSGPVRISTISNQANFTRQLMVGENLQYNPVIMAKMLLISFF